MAYRQLGPTLGNVESKLSSRLAEELDEEFEREFVRSSGDGDLGRRPGILEQKENDANRSGTPGGRSNDRITREVRHELVMLPYYGVFDNLAYRVDGSTVTLLGQVTRPTLKSDAGNVVKDIEGVEKVRQPNPGATEFADGRSHSYRGVQSNLWSATTRSVCSPGGATSSHHCG